MRMVPLQDDLWGLKRSVALSLKSTLQAKSLPHTREISKLVVLLGLASFIDGNG
jgi:hypothetical protein